MVVSADGLVHDGSQHDGEVDDKGSVRPGDADDLGGGPCGKEVDPDPRAHGGHVDCAPRLDGGEDERVQEPLIDGGTHTGVACETARSVGIDRGVCAAPCRVSGTVDNAACGEGTVVERATPPGQTTTGSASEAAH